MAEQTGLYVTSKFAKAIQSQPPVSHNGGRMRSVTDRMVAVDAAQGDTIHLAKLPSNAVIHAGSTLWHDDFGTGVTLEIGTYNARGIADDDDALATGVDVAAAAGSKALLGSPVTDHGKALWELAGLNQDPGGEIDIKALIGGANPDSAGLAWNIVYTID